LAESLTPDRISTLPQTWLCRWYKRNWTAKSNSTRKISILQSTSSAQQLWRLWLRLNPSWS
jgi:hypothetical protein